MAFASVAYPPIASQPGASHGSRVGQIRFAARPVFGSGCTDVLPAVSGSLPVYLFFAGASLAQASRRRRKACTARAGRDIDNPWEVLGVARTATLQEIRKAYRKKALREHPDVSKAADAKERWQTVSAAYELLSNPEKRAKLDKEEAARTARSSAYSEQRSSGGSSSYSSPADRAYEPRYSDSTDAVDSFRRYTSSSRTAKDIAAGVSRVGQVAGRVGQMALAELLRYLEGLSQNAQTMPRPVGGRLQMELREAEKEVEVLAQLRDRLLAEEQALMQTVGVRERAGDKVGEIRVIKQVLDLRERLKAVRERIVRAYKNIDYFRSVLNSK